MKIALEQVASEELAQSVRIVTDSNSVWDRLRTMSWNNLPQSKCEEEIMKILEELTQTNRELRVAWCPSHCDVPGNELADEAAKAGSNMDQTGTEWTYATSRPHIKRNSDRKPITNDRIKGVYEGISATRRWEDDLKYGRKEQVLLSRLRSGHHPDLNYWKHKIGEQESAACRICGEEDETVEHILRRCPWRLSQNPRYAYPDVLFDGEECLKAWTSWCTKVGIA